MTKRETLTLGWKSADNARQSGAQDDFIEVDEPVVVEDWVTHCKTITVDDVDAVTEAQPQSYQAEMLRRLGMLDTPAIFENAGQAIHVAYVIMSQPAQQDSMLRKSLVRILDSMSNLSPRLSAWLGQLKGEKSGTVHFDGLSSYDVRAQCSLILLAVRTRLPDPEMWAIQAKYAPTDFEDIGRKRRFAFSSEKAGAIQSLSRWLLQTSALVDVPAPVMDCMVGKFYANHAKTEISFRALANTFGGDHLKYFRQYGKVRKILRPLEDMAISRLRPYFAEQGIVADQVRDAA